MLPGLSSIHASPTYQVDSMTSDTLAMVSHDLRSTLNALGVTMDLLSEGHLGALNEKGQRLVSSSSAAVRLLINMTHNLIDSEEMDAGQAALSYSVTSLPQMIQQTVSMLESAAADKGIVVSMDVPEYTVRVDVQRLTRVFLNLLDNAIKFSPAGGSICITSRIVRGVLEVRFVDAGPGVPSDKLEGIFKKFERGHDGQVPGYGLGLAICKNVIETHGGTLGAENCAGGGSCFCIRIPIEKI